MGLSGVTRRCLCEGLSVKGGIRKADLERLRFSGLGFTFLLFSILKKFKFLLFSYTSAPGLGGVGDHSWYWAWFPILNLSSWDFGFN